MKIHSKIYRFAAATASLLLAASCTHTSGKVVVAERVAVAPVVKAAPADLTREVVLTAEFKPYQEVDVHAKIAGFLKKIYVDIGDRVRAGQLLAELEIPESVDEVLRAGASTRLSDANVVRAREELERAESAHQIAHLSYGRLAQVLKTRPNLVAQQEIDDAQARDRIGEAQVSSAKAALAAAQQQVEVSKADLKKSETLHAYTRITAPFAGVITNRSADTGAMIQAGTASQTQAMPVVRVSQNDTLRLVVPVPESIVPQVRLGNIIEVRVPTLQRSFSGRVARFSGRLSFATRTMDTEIDVPNPTLVLLPGMYAEAVLTLDRRKGALAIPLEAVANPDSEPSVLVVGADRRLEDRKVKLGIQTARLAEVVEGLKSGDLVISGSRSQFRPGQQVEPKEIHP